MVNGGFISSTVGFPGPVSYLAAAQIRKFKVCDSVSRLSHSRHHELFQGLGIWTCAEKLSNIRYHAPCIGTIERRPLNVHCLVHVLES